MVPSPKLFRLWREANLPFEYNENDGESRKTSPTLIRRNASRICIVSVHGINHYDKQGKHKQADLYTGGLALALANEYETNLICNIYRDIRIAPWGGLTIADQYIKQLADETKNLIVLDLHGAKNNDHFDIAVGTSAQPPNFYQLRLVRLLKKAARRYKLKIATNPPGYCGDGSHTITTRSLQKTPYCLQIELSRSCRASDGSTVQSKRMLRALHYFLDISTRL